LQSIKLVLKRLDHVSRATNVLSQSRLEILTSRLVKPTSQSREVSVSVSSFYISCPSLRAAATGNAGSPRVDQRVVGMTSVDVLADLSRRRASTSV